MNKERIFRNIHIFLVIALLSVVVFNGALGVVFATVVLDTTPPVLNLPSDMWVSAPGPSGAIVSFSATATDTDPTNPTVTCTPASGSVFPLGSTTVSCSATDTAGNTATGSFVVSVGGAKITSERVTLNGTSTVTVKGGDTVTATMVNTSVMSGEWMSTSYQIGGGEFRVDTPNHGVGVGYTESFPITAPIAEGVYTVMFGFCDTEGCLGDPIIQSGLPGGLIVDNTPPVLSLPADTFASASGPSGIAVSFSATATDTDPTNPTVTCTPASGSVFPLGSTTVSCSATDTAGNTATGSFVVSVGGAKITSERVTLNGTSTVTVKGGDTVTATMVNTSVMSGEWMSTSYQIGEGSVVCVDTPNHGVGTNYTESFPIVAPLAEGAYTVMFGFFSEENCSGDPAIRSGLPNGLVVDTTPSPAFSILGGSGGGSTESAVYRIGDINKDRQVNLLDLVLMMANWGKTGYNECDLNRDGIVDKYDFALLMLNWGL